jgi:hypothetical protein
MKETHKKTNLEKYSKRQNIKRLSMGCISFAKKSWHTATVFCSGND